MIWEIYDVSEIFVQRECRERQLGFIVFGLNSYVCCNKIPAKSAGFLYLFLSTTRTPLTRHNLKYRKIKRKKGFTECVVLMTTESSEAKQGDLERIVIERNLSTTTMAGKDGEGEGKGAELSRATKGQGQRPHGLGERVQQGVKIRGRNEERKRIRGRDWEETTMSCIGNVFNLSRIFLALLWVPLLLTTHLHICGYRTRLA